MHANDSCPLLYCLPERLCAQRLCALAQEPLFLFVLFACPTAEKLALRSVPVLE